MTLILRNGHCPECKKSPELIAVETSREGEEVYWCPECAATFPLDDFVDVLEDQNP